MAKKLEELPLYSRVIEFSSAVAAISDRPAFRRNVNLRKQIVRATDSIGANMEEGSNKAPMLPLRVTSRYQRAPLEKRWAIYAGRIEKDA
jgi:23S rRNA-intervening sequence protein